MGDQRTETLSEYMIRVRRDIHRHPETAWTEYRTTALVARELEKWGYQVLLAEEVLDLESRSALPAAGQLELAEMRAREEGVDPELMQRMAGGKTGVVGILKRSEGPVAALRVDMDALEVTESARRSRDLHPATRESAMPAVMTFTRPLVWASRGFWRRIRAGKGR